MNVHFMTRLKFMKSCQIAHSSQTRKKLVDNIRFNDKYVDEQILPKSNRGRRPGEAWFPIIIIVYHYFKMSHDMGFSTLWQFVKGRLRRASAGYF